MAKHTKKRQQANRAIIKILGMLVEKYPDQRFGQLLRNSGAIREFTDPIHGDPIYWMNDFYTEPWKTLEEMKKHVPDLLDGLDWARLMAEDRDA